MHGTREAVGWCGWMAATWMLAAVAVTLGNASPLGLIAGDLHRGMVQVPRAALAT